MQHTESEGVPPLRAVVLPRLHDHGRSLPRGAWLLLGAWLLTTVLALLLLPPRPLAVDAGSANDDRFLAHFYLSESTTSVTFRWSSPHARLVLHGSGSTPALLTLRLFGVPAAQQLTAPRSLELANHADTSTYARFALHQAEQWRNYHVLLPAAASSDAIGRVQPLRFRTAASSPATNDGRRLGVPLDALQLTPLLTGAPDLALLWRILLLGSLPLIAGLWLLRLPPRVPLPQMGAAVGVGLAVGLLLLAWRAPPLLAWLLPPLPWTVGLLTLLLLALPAHVAPQPQWFVGGVALLLLAQVCFTAQVSLLAGVVLAGGGIVLVARSTPVAQPASVGGWHRWHTSALAGVLLLALALRFYRLDSLPYGLWRDEARHLLLALNMLNDPTYRPIYEPAGGVHLPGLGFYPFALALHLWGVHVWTARVMTALAGALTLLPLAALAWLLWRRASTALLAAAMLAVSSWHITISRFSFPTIFEPLLSSSGLALLLWGWHLLPRARLWAAGLALAGGALIGGALQTYHTGRIAPLLLGLLLLLLLLHHRSQWRTLLLLGGAALLGFALTAAPFIGYAFRYPTSFNDRVGDVALLLVSLRDGLPPLGALDDSLGRHVAAFHWQGDLNGRHHAPGAPLLDPCTGLGMLLGLGVLAATWRDWRSQFVLLALAITLLPGVLAVDAPHGMRTFAAVCAACLIAALGWQCLLDWLHHLRHAPAWRAPAVAGGMLVLALAWNSHTYFVRMPPDERVWMSFYPVHTQIGSYVRERAATQGTAAVQQIYIAEHLMENEVLMYLTWHLPVQQFDERGHLSILPTATAQFVLSGYTHREDAARLSAALGKPLQPVVTGPDLPGRSEPAFVVYAPEP